MNKAQYILTFISLFIISSSIGQQDKLSILFEFDKYSINSQSSDEINEFIKNSVKNCDKINISIVGHTDSIGNTDYNYSLGLKRATEIANYINTEFGEILIETSISKSENNPVSSLENYKENRRVEIISTCITNLEPKIEALLTEDKIIQKFENDTLITFKNGTEMLVNSKTFYPNKIKDIDFKMTEVLSRTSMILNEMPTMTADGHCLESGGMIFGGASINGTDVVPGDSITFRIPADQIDTTMQLYDVKVVNGDTMWIESELDLNFNAEDGYYEFKSDRMPNINVDVPGAGIVTSAASKLFKKFIEDDLVAKNRWYTMKKSFLVSNDKLIVLKGVLFQKKKTKYKPCEVNDEDMLICLAERKGKLYMVIQPLSTFRYKSFWNRYIIKRKQYSQIENIEEYEDLVKKLFGDE